MDGLSGVAASVAVALAVGLAAYGDGTRRVTRAALTRDTAPLFQTDSLAYTLRAESDGYIGEIRVRFTNRTGGTVYFVNCRGQTEVNLEKLVDDRWRVVWGPGIPMCLSPPITVPAGGTYDSRIGVIAGYPGSNLQPQFSVPDVAGVYRAVWHQALSSYQDHLPFGEPLALEHRVSNRFRLEVQPR